MLKKILYVTLISVYNPCYCTPMKHYGDVDNLQPPKTTVHILLLTIPSLSKLLFKNGILTQKHAQLGLIVHRTMHFWPAYSSFRGA